MVRHCLPRDRAAGRSSASPSVLPDPGEGRAVRGDPTVITEGLGPSPRPPLCHPHAARPGRGPVRERVTGIEPAPPAWKHEIRPLRGLVSRTSSLLSGSVCATAAHRCMPPTTAANAAPMPRNGLRLGRATAAATAGPGQRGGAPEPVGDVARSDVCRLGPSRVARFVPHEGRSGAGAAARCRRPRAGRLDRPSERQADAGGVRRALARAPSRAAHPHGRAVPQPARQPHPPCARSPRPVEALDRRGAGLACGAHEGRRPRADDRGEVLPAAALDPQHRGGGRADREEPVHHQGRRLRALTGAPDRDHRAGRRARGCHRAALARSRAPRHLRLAALG